MDFFANLIVNNKKKIVIIFLATALLSAVMILGVVVNYDVKDYLPSNTPSTEALSIIESEFKDNIPNTEVMIENVSLIEALEYKEIISNVEGVIDVVWLDDLVDIDVPLEFYGEEQTEGFYKNNTAYYSVSLGKNMELSGYKNLQETLGDGVYISGDAPDNATMQMVAESETFGAALILLPAILIILIISTRSWIEPFLFLITIGVAVVINMGTNIFFPDISFITSSISPILQLAVSLDYSIFLLHSFMKHRKEAANADEAMKRAIKDSFFTIAASGLTTLFGFIALTFMNYGIGIDLGLNLAKGIILSFVSAMIFLPSIVLIAYKLIDKTQHKQLMPTFQNSNRILRVFAIPVFILVLLIIVPAFKAQTEVPFIYGNGDAVTSTISGQHGAVIDENFGQTNITVLLVPNGDIAKEKELSDEIKEIENVSEVISYADTVGTGVPIEFLNEEISEQFYSQNYARLLIYTDTAEEGDEAFSTVQEIRELSEEKYGEGTYTSGITPTLLDIKEVVDKDNIKVMLIAIVAIFLILLLTFRSISLALILLLTIEAAIWINLAVPYFQGSSINFIGYLVLNTVQLGATVDYAILLNSKYMTYRRLMPQKEAIHHAMGESFHSILISSMTLSIAGFALFATSTNFVTKDIGLLLCRGTILSVLMVVLVLPAMLRIFDKAIEKTTLNARFYKPPNLPQKNIEGNSQNKAITKASRKQENKKIPNVQSKRITEQEPEE